jgi:hypothetical protein
MFVKMSNESSYHNFYKYAEVYHIYSGMGQNIRLLSIFPRLGVPVEFQRNAEGS